MINFLPGAVHVRIYSFCSKCTRNCQVLKCHIHDLYQVCAVAEKGHSILPFCHSAVLSFCHVEYMALEM